MRSRKLSGNRPATPQGPSFAAFVERLGLQLTNGQRVLAAVAFDGLDPVDLTPSDQELARALFGPLAGIPHEARAVLAVVAGARAGKSYLLGALRLLHLAITVRLRQLAPGEVAVAVAVAPDLRLARQVLRYALGAAQGSAELAPLIANPTQDGFIIRRPDGRSVSIECLPATRGGAAVRGRTLVGAVLDEACFFYDAEHEVNDVDVYRALLPRIVVGGQLIIASTPWAESGLLWSLWRDNFGAPKACLVAHAPTALLRDDAHTRAMVERERARDAENARREFDAQFLSSDSALLSSADIDAAIEPGATGRDPVPGAQYAMAIDIGTRHDRTVIAVAHREILARRGAPPLDVLVLDFLRIVAPMPGKRVDLDAVEREVAAVSKAYGGARVWHDSYLADAIAPRLKARGIDCVEASMVPGAQGKRGTALAARFRSGTIRLIDDPILATELREVRLARHAGGRITIAAPNRKGAHDDCVDVLMLLCEACAELAPGGDIQRQITAHWSHERGLDVEERYFKVHHGDRGGVHIEPCEPPAGTPAAERAKRERNAQGIYTPSDIAEMETANPGVNTKVY